MGITHTGFIPEHSTIPPPPPRPLKHPIINQICRGSALTSLPQTRPLTQLFELPNSLMWLFGVRLARNLLSCLILPYESQHRTLPGCQTGAISQHPGKIPPPTLGTVIQDRLTNEMK